MFAGDRSSADAEDKTLVQDMITTLQAVKVGGQGMERRQCMTQLIRMARSGTTSGLNEHFRTVLRVLLENLEDSEGSTRALVFGVLTEMLKQESLQGGFHGFTELVILKVLQAHKDQEKDVSIVCYSTLMYCLVLASSTQTSLLSFPTGLRSGGLYSLLDIHCTTALLSFE